MSSAAALALLLAAAVGPADREAIASIRATAHVVVSDGLEYDVVTHFVDHQRAVFRNVYPDRAVSYGIDGKYYWGYDGEKESEGSAFFGGFVLGHQVHAQLLFFEELNGPLEVAKVDCGGKVCVTFTGRDGHVLRRELGSGRTLELSWAREGEVPVRLTFDDWREVEGVELPFAVRFDDGERLFDYAYGSVAFNAGSMDELRAPVEMLTDEQRLLRLHRRTMDAHFFEDPEMMKGYFAEEGVEVSRGAITRTSRAGSEAMMARIFGSRNHRRYDDLVRPIVNVSADGTLGWVVVQVEAAGVRLDDQGAPTGPLEFTAAWIALFEKIDGEWKSVGNVSNFKP